MSEVMLPPPAAGTVDLLIVAAEHSGDEHAGRMLRELLADRPELKVCALGGARLQTAGAQLLRDLTAQSDLGIAVIAKIFYYRALIDAIVDWIGRHRPKAVCMVDSSALNLRIARGLFERGYSAKAGGPTKTLYYISPQIWASRAGRRFDMAKHLDGLAAIFPFEPAVYADTSLPVEFVGHPFVAPDYAAPVAYDPAGPVLLLPGSRRGAVARIFPALLDGFKAWSGGREAVVLHPGDEIEAVLRAAHPPAGVTLRRTGEGAPAAASAVLTSSGTMSLHCALAGIPGAIAYRTDLLTYWIGRSLVKVPYLGIANLLLKEPMYPEYLQGAATPAALASELKACVTDRARIVRTAEQAARLRGLLGGRNHGTAAGWLAGNLF
ncbi:MAG: Lipid-A-disaccharide synthase [Verrucomicrobiota bacterium]|jgi:lipid-A-disaccharide synthase